jgi:hypothetical protein
MHRRENLTPQAAREHVTRGQDGAADGIDSRVGDNGSSPRPRPDVPGTWSREAANPFAQMPKTLDSIIAQVRRQLADDAPWVMRVEPAILDEVAERAVRELWGGRIKTFVPVLALRQAREILRDQESVVSVSCPQGRDTVASMGLSPLEERRVCDGLPIDSDVMTSDDRDVL